MIPSTICLRCQSRLLQRYLHSSTRGAHDFVSLRHDNAPLEVEQNQDKIVPSTQTEHQQDHKPQWQPPRPSKRQAGNMEDSMKSLLDSLFDSNRHETPKSPVYRYSRRPIEQPPLQQPQAIGAANGSLPKHVYPAAKLASSSPRDSMPAGYKNQKTRSDKSRAIPHSSTTGTADIFTAKNRSTRKRDDNTLNNLDTLPSRMRAGVNKSIIGTPGSSTIATTDSDIGANSMQEMPNSNDSDMHTGSLMPSSTDGAAADIESGLGEAQVRRIASFQTVQAQKKGLSFEQFRNRVVSADIRSTNELWQQFHEHKLQTRFKKTDLAMLFGDFLWAFGKLRKIEPLMEVWSSMSEQGISPTIRHWNAVLKVLQRNRDLQQFQAIWQAILDSGAKPDRESWTIHIQLLLAQPRHDWRAAMQLLDIMGKSWREAEAEQTTSNIQPGYLPSTGPINAAITGLLELHLTAQASDVFKWAHSFPVPIDTTCYNIFVRYACQHGDDASISSILQEMESNGFKQDVVTKTIILDRAIRSTKSGFHVLGQAEQERFVVEKLNQMTNEGTPPNAQTFAVAVDALLHQPIPNVAAAQAVLQISHQIGQKVSPQIYTIILMHHFNPENPNLDAVESLWNEIEAQGTKIDHILYDRMIEGYAAVGQLEKMLAFFKEMTATGQTPGWWAMEKALSALVTANAWKLCAEFVANVTNENNHLHVSKRGWRGEKEFWHLVSDLQEQKLIPARKAPQT